MEADKEDILGAKKRNYEFLQLVRDKKYGEALILGKEILRQSPDNPSVRKFIDFIEKNAKKLDEMVKEEQQYESVDSDDEEQQEEEEVEENENKEQKSSQQKESEEDQEEEEQEEQEVIKVEKKIELTTCTLNQIPHICPRHHREGNNLMNQQK